MKYKDGTRLKVMSRNDGRDIMHKTFRDNDIITVKRSFKYPYSYQVVEEKIDSGWYNDYIETLEIFKPIQRSMRL